VLRWSWRRGRKIRHGFTSRGTTRRSMLRQRPESPSYRATNFFAAGKDSLHRNQYGGTLGGPVRIPKLFDGRNKLFVFAGFQHTKERSASATQKAYVPTAANLQGDFSITDPAPAASGGTGVKNNCGAPVQLYDPITGQKLPGNKYNYSAMGLPAVPLPTFNASALAPRRSRQALCMPAGSI
jgi:hypothetical protein